MSAVILHGAGARDLAALLKRHSWRRDRAGPLWLRQPRIASRPSSRNHAKGQFLDGLPDRLFYGPDAGRATRRAIGRYPRLRG